MSTKQAHHGRALVVHAAPCVQCDAALDASSTDPRLPWPDRCNAHREDDTHCHRKPLKRRKRCAKHGGRQGTGPANSNWRGGKSQAWIRKHLPAGMLKQFDDILNDPDLISMRSLMALNGVRISDLLRKLPTGESKQVLSTLRGILQSQATWMQTLSVSPGISDVLRKSLEQCKEQLENGLSLCDEAAQTSAVWDEVAGVVEGQRRLSDTERRREEALMSSITMPQAVALFNGLFTLINKVVRSEDERLQLSDGLRALLEHRASEQAEVIEA